MFKRKHDPTKFKMCNANIYFQMTNDSISCSDTTLNFNYGYPIPINEEINEVIFIGNNAKEKATIQITMKEDESNRCEIKTNPLKAELKKGEACQFSVIVKLKCACKIESEMVINAQYKKETKMFSLPFKVEGHESVLSANEVREMDQIGEGPFTLVNLGIFKENNVVIKRKKNEEPKEELMKEVEMLNKLRSSYIIYFYGVLFSSRRMCTVMEYAEHGSLNDLIKKKRENPIDKRMRIKILIDTAKGIEYLHSNGILHRNIKPDNILITSLEESAEVNGKLTDFGKARSVPFTNETITPAYTAPEILYGEEFQKPADIFSFAITMYECMKWNECYPQSEFECPQKIVEFVKAGRRVPRHDSMGEEYSIIEKSWRQEGKERITIEEIIKELEEMKQ